MELGPISLMEGLKKLLTTRSAEKCVLEHRYSQSEDTPTFSEANCEAHEVSLKSGWHPLQTN